MGWTVRYQIVREAPLTEHEIVALARSDEIRTNVPRFASDALLAQL